MSVDSTIVCIIARELLEATMFVTSHVGAVKLSLSLDEHEKARYTRSMWMGLAGGFLGGTAISLAVGFSLADALHKVDSISNGVEAGEGASKCIAAFFVSSLAIKLPQWFGFSNYVKDRNRVKDLAYPRVPTEDVIAIPKEADSVDEKIVAQSSDLEAAAVDTLPDSEAGSVQEIDSALSMSMSLFWNSLRECTEGGVLTAIAALLSQDTSTTIGNSVAVGVGCTIGLAIIIGLGAKYISSFGFGVVATGFAQCLAIGLVTGAARSFEETYAANNNDQRSAIIYDVSDTQTGNILTSFEFIGISDNLTLLVLLFWIGSAVILCLMQYWQNYLGRPFIPRKYNPKARISEYLASRKAKSLSTTDGDPMEQ